MTEKQLGEYILKGLESKDVVEDKNSYISATENFYNADIVGLAYIGFIGDPAQAYLNYANRNTHTSVTWLAKELDISWGLLVDISKAHFSNSAKVIAEHLIKGNFHELEI